MSDNYNFVFLIVDSGNWTWKPPLMQRLCSGGALWRATTLLPCTPLACSCRYLASSRDPFREGVDAFERARQKLRASSVKDNEGKGDNELPKSPKHILTEAKDVPAQKEGDNIGKVNGQNKLMWEKLTTKDHEELENFTRAMKIDKNEFRASLESVLASLEYPLQFHLLSHVFFLVLLIPL